MPSRMLRDWTDSYRVNKLDAKEERFFIRLIMKADDYGRFHADPRLIRSFCFPLNRDVRDTDISRWVAACQTAGLIRCYSCRQGRKYLEIVDFKQRLRLMKPRFPAPSGDELPGICPPEAEEETEQKGIEATPLASGPAIAHEIAGYWNSKPTFRHVAHLNPERLKKIAARLKENFFVANWRLAIDRASGSGFCTGAGDKGWRADIDWFLRPGKVAEIMEGKYDDRQPVLAPAKPVSVYGRIKSTQAVIADLEARIKAIPVPMIESDLEGHKQAIAARAPLREELGRMKQTLADLNRQAATE